MIRIIPTQKNLQDAQEAHSPGYILLYASYLILITYILPEFLIRLIDTPNNQHTDVYTKGLFWVELLTVSSGLFVSHLFFRERPLMKFLGNIILSLAALSFLLLILRVVLTVAVAFIPDSFFLGIIDSNWNAESYRSVVYKVSSTIVSFGISVAVMKKYGSNGSGSFP